MTESTSPAYSATENNQQKSWLSKKPDGVFDGKFFVPSNIPHGADLLTHSLNSYGFLIEVGEKLSCVDFATRIRRTYDCVSNPQNRAVAECLESLV